jgi:site-specific DNA recombinase
MRKATKADSKLESRASVNTVRCAVYTRKSSEKGLEQEFNSLDAQREAGEAFIRSQAGEGWVLLPDRYDDGGFTGGNTDRPAVQRLLVDIQAGRIDCVVVYKVDRLSRSLLDFAGMMQTFEKHKVSFVSVSQQFNTASSMGRLMLNVLLSFAQFEREIISERTRDKIAATRRKGKWAGGHPILGYDIDPNGYKLRVNESEADRVRDIFDLYLERGSLLPVVEELVRRGWVNKLWTTRKGLERGGKPFTRTSLYKVLTNIVYVGKVRYKTEHHNGEHPGIVDPGVFQRTQDLLHRNGSTGGTPIRDKFQAILKGLIKCGPCGCAMTPSYTSKGGTRRYRYYLCSSAQKKGWATCPSKSIPATQIEEFVVGQIRCIGRDPALLREVLAQARAQADVRTAELETEVRGLTRDMSAWQTEIGRLACQLRPGEDNGVLMGRLAELHERIVGVEGRVKQLREQIRMVTGQLVSEEEATRALSAFHPVWGTMTPHEQARVVQLLVERVDYDGGKQKVAVTFRPSGIKTLADELAERSEEAVA